MVYITSPETLTYNTLADSPDEIEERCFMSASEIDRLADQWEQAIPHGEEAERMGWRSLGIEPAA